MMDRLEFVEDWNIIQILGEGAFGEVKLLMHRLKGDTVAVKIIDLKKHRDAHVLVKKEICIHRLLLHDHIIKFLGKREESCRQYIFLEYAAGGELFNRIDPDSGMSSHEAQQYMKQLLSGVDYLHQKGIAHRDIKPENLLLDQMGNLKISDFGMATIFRLKGRERKLEKRCGTLPYVAPEVLVEPYFAQPADLWSCGVVFVAMLAGELPWDEPTDSCRHYAQWAEDSYVLATPWSKLENSALSLSRKILNPIPEKRPNMTQIRGHPWMQTEFKKSGLGFDFVDGDGKNKKRTGFTSSNRELPTVVLSQPLPRNPPIIDLAPLLKPRAKVCFSQPTQNEDLYVSSEIQFTQSPVTQDNFQMLVKRMTRFFVKTSCEKTVEVLCTILDKSHYSHSTDVHGVISISTIDSRKMPLIFKATLIDMDGKLLLDFRLAKGCGLEFKRRFIKIKQALSDIILHNTV